MKINQILKKGVSDLRKAGISNPQLEAEILLLTAIGQNWSREWLLVNSDYKLDNSSIEQFQKFIERRQKFEPIAFITNHKEFYGYDFYVDNHVLIPRPESEILVEKSLSILRRAHGHVSTQNKIEWSIVNCQLSIVELGTGSGCIIISVIKELQRQKVNLSNFKFTATDISKDALWVARKNARRHNVDQLIHLVQSDLFDYFDSQMSDVRCQMFNLIIANLPYVPSYWLSQSDWTKTLYYEPNVALDGGKDGLDVYLRFFQEVPKYLAKHGAILIECEDDQIEKILKIIKNLNYKFSHQIFKDYNNLQRVIQIDNILNSGA